MRDKDLTDIKGLALFQDMKPENFDRMMRGAYDQEFPEHLQLFQQGGKADFLHVLIEGTVVLSADWREREATMAVVRPVSSFILAACMLDMTLLMSARTLSRSRLVLIPSQDVREIFRIDPDFAVAANRQLAMGYRQMVDHAKGLKLRRARERLAAYILDVSEKHGHATEIVIEQEKRILASYLGMTPESLSRAFKSLAEDGVHVHGANVTINDLTKLIKLVGEDWHIPH
ncbi:helix-turn-helix domain-containing protein [Paracoccus aestuariivivens]|uniref:Helix-turn-helix domain-containing protein n=1 Tax=Paracoccus aestuariivivens TaxID=1820333 RepID=A0A6L6J9N2_9RHOB|nr:helix-turn-helix domain-containing protein [Paracoccus aestuariivivens]